MLLEIRPGSALQISVDLGFRSHIAVGIYGEVIDRSGRQLGGSVRYSQHLVDDSARKPNYFVDTPCSHVQLA